MPSKDLLTAEFPTSSELPDSERARQLAALHSALRGCRKCLEAGHAITPPPVVHGVFGARVMTIGQAPGPTEVVAQRPFNAGSGRRLFQWLGQAGFDEANFRATQAMVAVTRCYPGKGKGGHGDRVPGKDEQALCRPWLEQELALIQPQLIIPIGKLAIGLFFDLALALEDVIGTRHEINGRVVIPLPHPSGASTWPNKPENAERIQRAIAWIAAERRRVFGG
ncbi:MAG: uracil-DNA glycosylase family protein [Anaerolineales bacterium]|nr:uracil-DNA glycosylase family protein [Anaerolineales bacterium]